MCFQCFDFQCLSIPLLGVGSSIPLLILRPHSHSCSNSRSAWWSANCTPFHIAQAMAPWRWWMTRKQVQAGSTSYCKGFTSGSQSILLLDQCLTSESQSSSSPGSVGAQRMIAVLRGRHRVLRRSARLAPEAPPKVTMARVLHRLCNSLDRKVIMSTYVKLGYINKQDPNLVHLFASQPNLFQ